MVLGSPGRREQLAFVLWSLVVFVVGGILPREVLVWRPQASCFPPLARQTNTALFACFLKHARTLARSHQLRHEADG